MGRVDPAKESQRTATASPAAGDGAQTTSLGPVGRMQARLVPRQRCLPYFIFERQPDAFACDHEVAMPEVVNGLRRPSSRAATQAFADLEDEQAVRVDHGRVNDLALETGEALLDQWGLDEGWPDARVSPKRLNLSVRLAARVAAADDLAWPVPTAGTLMAQAPDARSKVVGVVAVADDASDQRRLELEHRLPGHRHDVRLPGVGASSAGRPGLARSTCRPSRAGAASVRMSTGEAI